MLAFLTTSVFRLAHTPHATHAPTHSPCTHVQEGIIMDGLVMPMEEPRPTSSINNGCAYLYSTPTTQ